MAITINNLIGGDIIINTKPQITELCFTAEEDNSSVELQKNGSAYIDGFNGLEYKLNDGNWTSYAIGSTISLQNVDDKVYMRAVKDGNSRMGTYNDYYYFVMTGKIAASGNVNTLLNPDPNADVSLEGKDYCYSCMFDGCIYLTQAPVLPATTLAESCYECMFQNCSSLTQAPELPATTLANYCYNYMFSGCSKFSEVHMKSSMNGVYNTDTHGDIKKTVVYDL